MNFIHNVSRLGNRPFHGQVTSSRCCPEISLIALRSPSVREARLGHPKHLDREHMRYSFPQVYLCRKEYRLVRCARGEARTRDLWIRSPLLYPTELRGHPYRFNPQDI